MLTGMTQWLWQQATSWLTTEGPFDPSQLSDFERLSYEIRPGDIILVEGRSRLSEVIKTITQSSWTHAGLYIGKLHDIDSPALRDKLGHYYQGDPSAQLLVEAILGMGTIVRPLTFYQRDHLRICRPSGLSRHDAQNVIGYCINKLGTDYDIRQLLDLARFMFPYGVLPRRWRSSLFEHNAGAPTKTVCSTMLAEAFNSVHFPILPFIRKDVDGNARLYKRNPRLFSPKDFDYSPYFDIIKYPFYGIEDIAMYRQLPWDPQGMICNDENECYIPVPAPSKQPPQEEEDSNSKQAGAA